MVQSRGLGGEVIHRTGRFRVRIAQRQHEFSEFAPVAEEARWIHVRRGNGCRFASLASRIDAPRCGRVMICSRHDDVFDLLQPLAI